MESQLTFVDLFCGGGFGARGAVVGGGVPLLGVDSWSLATETYRANFPNAEVICSHIENLDPFEVAQKYKPDVLLTSPECTSHSIARGSKPVSEKSRETAMGILPWLEAMEPRWLVVENVNRMKKWNRHDELVRTIENAGYRVSDLFLNAAVFGTPQKRKRMFLVCDREGTTVDASSLTKGKRYKNRIASDVIAEESKFRSRPLYSEGRAKGTIERAERAISKLGRNVPFLVVYYGSDYAGGWQPLDVPLRTITTIDRFGLVTWKNKTPYLRMLQPCELMQAMGAWRHKLPHGTRRDKVRLCGNGVCAPVITAIFRHMHKQKQYEQFSVAI